MPKLKVKVIDKDTGEPLFARVLISDQVAYKLVTDESGEAEVSLPEGKYTVEVRATHYAPKKREIVLDRDREITFELEVLVI